MNSITPYAQLVRWSLLCGLFVLCAPANANDPWCAGKADDRVYRFEWRPDTPSPSQKTGRVVVLDATSGRVLQELSGHENYYRSSDALQVQDLNNDGCPDLRWVVNSAAIGNENYAAFLYDPKARRFVYDAALSDIVGLDRDLKDPNCVTGTAKGGAMDFYWEQRCWVKGKLVQIQEKSTTPLYGQDGEVACYEHTTVTYQAGKRTEKKICTKNF